MTLLKSRLPVLMLLLLACGLQNAVPTTQPISTPQQEATLAPESRSSETPVLALTATDPPASSIPFTPSEHLIQIRSQAGQAEFYDIRTGEAFVPRGVNYFWIVSAGTYLQDRIFQVGAFDPDRIAADFATLHQAGYNTVRIFLDTCNDAPGCTGNPAGPGLNPAYVDNIAETIVLARDAGIFLLLTSNDLPGQGGYWTLVDEATSDQFGPYRNAHYLTDLGVEAGRRYWRDLMSGLAERQPPFEVVLGWSLLNEQWYFNTEPPFSLNNGIATTANGRSYDLADPDQHQALAVESMRFYIDELSAVIRTYDPEALITMGFFVPDYPEPIRQGEFRYVETAALLIDSSLDFFDFHAYPGEESLAQLVTNFGMGDYSAKPIILGETGAFIDRYASADSAAQVMRTWIGESCQLGFDGFLYWGLYRAPEAIGDASWGLLEADQTLLQALSLPSFADPCNPVHLPPENLALNQNVLASNALPLEFPEQAVDGGALQWGAGQEPPQWIQIDLGRPQTISRILLVVAQFPAGETVHQIWGRGPDESLRLLHEFRGTTAEGDILEFVPELALDNIQYLRIVTTQSPSWVALQEIEVYGLLTEDLP